MELNRIELNEIKELKKICERNETIVYSRNKLRIIWLASAYLLARLCAVIANKQTNKKICPHSYFFFIYSSLIQNHSLSVSS